MVGKSTKSGFFEILKPISEIAITQNLSKIALPIYPTNNDTNIYTDFRKRNVLVLKIVYEFVIFQDEIQPKMNVETPKYAFLKQKLLKL